MRIPRGRRIVRRGDFQRVRQKGRSFAGKYLVLGVLYDPEQVDSIKIGFITTKKLGNAVVRSRTRRRLRAIVQRHGEHLKHGHWIVTIPRYTAPGAESAALEKEWKYLAHRAKLFLEDDDPT